MRPPHTKDSLRQSILDAAGELFVSFGYENTSMRKIAERIRYSPTTIYLHFRDKADLFQCLCKDTFGSLTGRFENLRHPSGDPVELLKLGCRAYVEFGLEHPSHYQATFMMCDRQQLRPEESESVQAAGMEAFAHLRRGVQNCIDAGRFPNTDAETASQVIWSSLHGLTSLLIAKCGFPWVEQDRLVTTLVDTLIEGFSVSGDRAATRYSANS